MKSARRKAYFIDAGYTVKKGKTYVSLILKGKKTVKLFYRYDPYFLVDAPTERKEEFLNIEAPRKNGEITSPLDVDEVEVQVGLEKKKDDKAHLQGAFRCTDHKACHPLPLL
jgi:hypothetical protein